MKKTHLQLLSSLGYSVIPCKEDKRPDGAWKDFQTTARTSEQIELLNAPLYGLITGFNYLEVLDIDLKVLSTAKEQLEWWAEFLSFLQDNILDFNDKFVIKKTKNNGYHILYKSKRVEGNQKIASLKGHTEAIIETRGIGGMVIAYDKHLGDLDYQNIQFISDNDRNILFLIAETYNYIDTETVKIAPAKKDFVQIEGEITAWDDFNNKNSVWDIVSEDFTIIRNLADKYIIKRHNSESVHSGYIYKDKDLMFLHSTGTIYQSEKQYTAFSAYTCKYFNSNRSAASKQAYLDGYGTRRIKKEQEPKENIQIETKDLEFPIDIFPKTVQTYISECSTTLNSNVDYMGSSLLWLTSLCIGNAMKIEVKKGWQESAVVWLAVVGKAGIGKTPSISNIIFPLEKQNNKEISSYIKDYEKFEHYDNLTPKDKKDYPEIQKPIKKQFIANDITLEALVDLHQENDNGVGVFKDELAGWFKDMNKYKQGSDLEFWLSTWSGKSVNLNRISRAGSFVSSPMIPILGGIQPAIFNSFYTEENKDNGFMDRMLLSYPDLKVEKYNDAEMSYDTINWFSDKIVSFYESIKNNVLRRNRDGSIEPIVLKFSPEAKTEWIRIFNEITETQNSDEENEYMKSMLPKQKSYIPRFALLIQVFSDTERKVTERDLISKESILKAEQLSKYFIAMAKKIKIDSIETSEIKNVIVNNKGKSTKEKFQILYSQNPKLNKKETSEQLGVSLTMIYKYIKQLEKNV